MQFKLELTRRRIAKPLRLRSSIDTATGLRTDPQEGTMGDEDAMQAMSAIQLCQKPMPFHALFSHEAANGSVACTLEATFDIK